MVENCQFVKYVASVLGSLLSVTLPEFHQPAQETTLQIIIQQ